VQLGQQLALQPLSPLRCSNRATTVGTLRVSCLLNNGEARLMARVKTRDKKKEGNKNNLVNNWPKPWLIERLRTTWKLSLISGTFRDFWKKKRRLKPVFYFFTYECYRRRLSLIKIINGVDEVLILLFTAFGYENLFWSYVVRVWIVRLFIREKIRFVSKKTNDKKKDQTKNIWREKCFNKSI